MISILTVNRNCKDWLELQVKSIRKFSFLPNEIIVIDNDSVDGSIEWLKEQSDVRATMLNHNIGHGAGLDMAVHQARYRFCLVLDIDAHILRKGWDTDLVDLYIEDGSCRLIAAKGGDRKPVHPCFMFFEKRFILDNKISFKPTKEYDVGRKIYPDTLKLGHTVRRVPVDYEPGGQKFYPGAYGDTYYVNGVPTVYHNWYSSRMYGKQKVDNLNVDEYTERKTHVFNHPHVRGILDER